MSEHAIRIKRELVMKGTILDVVQRYNGTSKMAKQKNGILSHIERELRQLLQCVRMENC